MVDNLKKKKLDSKRISIGQKHEVDYLKMITEEVGKAESWRSHYYSPNSRTYLDIYPSKVRRIAKALLKALDRIKILENKLREVGKNGRKKR